jgi:hypothetical protein
MPTSAFSNQGHSDQLAVTTIRFWPGAFAEWRNRFPNVIDNHKYPDAKIFEVGYHRIVLLCDELSLATHSYHTGGFFVNQSEYT